MDENPHLPPFECSDFVFRVLPYDSLLKKDGTHRPKTFLRRSHQDPNGLSVMTAIQVCKGVFDRPVFGVRSVHVGWLRDNGYEVFRTSPTHANIRYRTGANIPLPVEDEPTARNVADDLMRLSRPVSYWDDADADERFFAEYLAKRAARQPNP